MKFKFINNLYLIFYIYPDVVKIRINTYKILFIKLLIIKAKLSTVY